MTDVDVAMHLLAVVLGIVSAEVNFAVEVKHLYWTDNPVGNMRNRMIKELVSQGFSIESAEQDQVMWNPKS
ncbi:MAG: hypothetical protein AAGC44_05060 [Planctomycetota bacterium]